MSDEGTMPRNPILEPQTAATETEAERAALFAELWALEDAPRDDGLDDMLKARLVENIEQRLDVIGRA